MINNWKILISLDGKELCDEFYFFKRAEETELSFIPRVGEMLFIGSKCFEELKSEVKKCWQNNKCDWCPYLYRKRESVDDIEITDYFYVKEVSYHVDDKKVNICLADSPTSSNKNNRDYV